MKLSPPENFPTQAVVTASPPQTTTAPPRSLFTMLIALIKALRPKQASKNLFLYAALVFAGRLFDGTAFLRVTLAFALFTAITGSVYLLNDLLDVEQDRQHPTKCRRPLASGTLPVGLAQKVFVHQVFLSARRTAVP